ncbi:hypothetical protein KAI68_06625 [bacterium]|nr:hypothetical protein [bacterium]
MEKIISFIRFYLLILFIGLLFYSFFPKKSYAWEWQVSVATTTYDFGRVGLNFSTSTSSGYFGVWSSHSSLMELWSENSQDWTKGDSAGNEIFCLKAQGGELVSFTSIASTQTINSGLPKGTTQTFDLELNSPTNTTATLTQNIAVKLQAGLPAGYIYLADGDLYYKNVGYGTSESDYSSALDTCITPLMKNTYTGWSQMDTYSSSVRVSFPGFGPQTKYSYSILGGFYFPVTSSFSSSSSSRQVNTTTRLTQWHTIWYAGWEDNSDSSIYLTQLLRAIENTSEMVGYAQETIEIYYRNQIVILD